MRYGGTLISVKDMEKSKNFYENIMEQKITMDLGSHVTLENGLGLQADYEQLLGVKLNMQAKADNFQLYFEVDDIYAWEQKLKTVEGLEFLHPIKEYPWGQHVMRFYDFDQYIIEVAESMDTVIRRCLQQGLSVEETAKRTLCPVEFIRQFVI